MYKLLMVFFPATFFMSCSDGRAPFSSCNINPISTELELTTRVFTFWPPALKETSGAEVEMGLYVVTGSSAVAFIGGKTAGPVRMKGMRSPEGRVLRWKSEVPVLLDKEAVSLYAYAPYSERDGSDGRAVPVHICSDARYTPGYRCGKLASGHKPVNRVSPVAMIALEPVLSQIVFELTAEAGLCDSLCLDAVQIGSKPGGTAFRRKGKMDVSTGRIVSDPLDGGGATCLRLDTAVYLSTIPFQTPGIFVFPTETPAGAGATEVIFFFGEKRYIYALPEGTCWKRGRKYVYRLVFTERGLRLKKTVERWIEN